MLQPKTFILEECGNVSRILHESLRYDYGTTEENPFFDELRSRLTRFHTDLSSSDQSPEELETSSKIVSELSTCISLIERSHLGEFSWAFAECLKRIARRICVEKNLRSKFGDKNKVKDPIFHISSEGGLASYKIVCESEILLAIGDRRIFNIVFPRSLKSHVLLHAVLAHEVGHAALSIPGHLIGNAKNAISDGILTNRKTALQWIKKLRPAVKRVDMDQLDSWLTEFLCDLFGLLLMGPSFAGALLTLLAAKDPGGVGAPNQLGSHPPFHARLAVILQAVNILKWTNDSRRLPKLVREANRAYWNRLLNFLPNRRLSQCRLFTNQQVTHSIRAIKKAIPSSEFFESVNQIPLNSLLNDLIDFVPPTGSRVLKNGDVSLERIDFRLIVHAGWLLWALKEQRDAGEKPINIKFFDTNRLCERGILQQFAIDEMIARSSPSNS